MVVVGVGWWRAPRRLTRSRRRSEPPHRARSRRSTRRSRRGVGVVETSVSRSRSPVLVELRDARDVARGHVAAAGGAEQPSLAEERSAVDRDRLARRRRADHHAAAAGRVDEERCRRRVRGGRPPRTPTSTPPGTTGCTASTTPSSPVGSTVCVAPSALRELELPRVGVERDDRGRAGDARALHHVEPDAAAPDHRDRLAGAHVGDVEHRPEPGGHTAPGEADHVERDVRGRSSPPGRPAAPRPRRGCRSRPSGTASSPSATAHAVRAVGHPPADRGDARGAVAQHEPTGAARRRTRRTGRTARAPRDRRLHARHAVADCFHDARAFVAEHHRERVDHRAAVHDVEVRPADAGRGDPHEHLAGAGRVDLDLLERAAPSSTLADDDGLCAHGP